MQNEKQMNIYNEFRDACHRHGKSLSAVLQEIESPTSVTGGWKKGQSPRLFTAMRISEYLDMSLDELCYGLENTKAKYLTDEEREWIYLMNHIPADRKPMCIDFLKTHAMVPDMYEEKSIIS